MSKVKVAGYSFQKDENGKRIDLSYTPQQNAVNRRLLNDYFPTDRNTGKKKYNPYFSEIRRWDLRSRKVQGPVQRLELSHLFTDYLMVYTDAK